LTTWHFILSAE